MKVNTSVASGVPPVLKPASLVAALPPGAASVPNDVYRTAATERLEAAAEPRPERKPDPYRVLQYGLDRAGIDEARPLTTGRGARVALLDSRPDLDHPDLGDVELLETGRVDERPGTHGTLIAGVLAATPDNGFGIAGSTVLGELPLMLVSTRELPEQGQLEMIYLRRVVERCVVEDVYELQHDDQGEPAVVPASASQLTAAVPF